MANSSLKVVQSQPSSDDVQVYNQIRNGLMSNQITSRQVYDSLKKGDFTPGTITLLYDIIDFGKYEAEDSMKNYKGTMKWDRSQGPYEDWFYKL